jgi:hypothetical protein
MMWRCQEGIRRKRGRLTNLDEVVDCHAVSAGEPSVTSTEDEAMKQ